MALSWQCGWVLGFQGDAEKIIPLLVTFTMLPFLNPFSTRYLTALGKHGLLARLYPYKALASIILGILLVGKFGLVGVAMGMLIPTFVVMPIILRQCCKYLGMTIPEYVRDSIYPSLLPSVLLVIVVSAYRNFTGLTTYPELLIAVLLGAIVYIAVFAFTGLRQNERHWMLARARKFAGWQGG